MTSQRGVLVRLMGFAAGLRFPRLLAITAVLFILDMIIPDMIPFADEILLGLLSLVLASRVMKPFFSSRFSIWVIAGWALPNSSVRSVVVMSA